MRNRQKINFLPFFFFFLFFSFVCVARTYRVAETIELSLGLGLGGLKHEGVGDGPRHGGRVEAVVVETLGNVDGLNTVLLFKVADVEDKLVRAHAILVGVENLVVVLKALAHVVGVEDGRLCGLLEASAAHHLDVGVRDRENGRRRERGRSDGANGLFTTGGDDRVGGEEGSKVRLDTDGSHARATATVGDTEGLVQVEMAHICAIVTRAAETDLGVHVGTIEVDLATKLVDELAGILDTFGRRTTLN